MTLNEREKELELFNAFVKKELPELFEKYSSGNFFAKVTYDSMFGAWLGAKAQAVPEGYTLINNESLLFHSQSIRMFNDGNLENHYEEIEEHVCSIEGMVKVSESGAEQ